jgi:L-seryl-tRNA(Ser) seleniumtransferase
MINATGVLVHTDLGRAPLSAAAREAVRAATGCTDVEFDLATGKRGRSRQPGAVHVVKNDATPLALAATSKPTTGWRAE